MRCIIYNYNKELFGRINSPIYKEAKKSRTQMSAFGIKKENQYWMNS